MASLPSNSLPAYIRDTQLDLMETMVLSSIWSQGLCTMLNFLLPKSEFRLSSQFSRCLRGKLDLSRKQTSHSSFVLPLPEAGSG